MNRLEVYYGIGGALLSLIIFIVLQNFLRATDVQGFIFTGTITLSSVICYCTGMVIETLKGKNLNKKSDMINNE